MALPKFPKSSDNFSQILKERVNSYFVKNNIEPTGNAELYTKAIVLTIMYIALYVHLVFFTPSTVWAIIESALIGITIAGIGFNIMHDGGHGSFSTKPWANYMAFFSLNLLGGSSFMWNVKHNVIHHAYTNVDGLDDDIDAKPFLRMAETQPKYKLHKYQHLYFWVLYTFLYLFWIFFSDYNKYFTKRIGEVPLKKMNLTDHIIFWSAKFFFYFYIIVFPIIYLGFVPWLIGFLTATLIGGLVLSIVFQLAHTVEGAAFPQPDTTSNKLEDEWTIHQLKTTANFATDNKFVCWYVGGLNFQVEHHLFPKISHVHYPQINKIVKDTCLEFGVGYIEYPNVTKAVTAHVKHLKFLGNLA